MTLTRAAFAVMIKFQSLTSTLQDFIQEIQACVDFGLPREAGEERNDGLLNVFDDFFKKDEILTTWSNATKMRRWLIHKKQLVSEKLEFEEDRETKEKETIKSIIAKVVEKAEFLSVLVTFPAAIMAGGIGR